MIYVTNYLNEKDENAKGKKAKWVIRTACKTKRDATTLERILKENGATDIERFESPYNITYEVTFNEKS